MAAEPDRVKSIQEQQLVNPRVRIPNFKKDRRVREYLNDNEVSAYFDLGVINQLAKITNHELDVVSNLEIYIAFLQSPDFKYNGNKPDVIETMLGFLLEYLKMIKTIDLQQFECQEQAGTMYRPPRPFEKEGLVCIPSFPDCPKSDKIITFKIDWKAKYDYDLNLDEINYLYIPNIDRNGNDDFYFSLRDLICKFDISFKELEFLSKLVIEPILERTPKGKVQIYKVTPADIMYNIGRYKTYFSYRNSVLHEYLSRITVDTITQSMLRNKYLKYKEKYLKLKSKMI